MVKISNADNQMQYVTHFQDLVSTPFYGNTNVICWKRNLIGDFSEIVNQVEVNENIVELGEDELLALQLSEQGQLAREMLLSDLNALRVHGASPTLNLIKHYDRDESYPFFPTDVYSFHVDRSPIPVDTFLCTYYGESSEILPNAHGEQKVLVPEIRAELKKIHRGADEDFDSFLSEHFFDLHYLAQPNAKPIKLGLGHLCRLAINTRKAKCCLAPIVHQRKKMERKDCC
jgi:hypothetical protein